MTFVWTADLETGNPTIDGEHKQLIDAINSLLAACSKGQGRAELERTTRFLQDYTAKHFSHEEQLQLASKYPDYQNHKKYHDAFKVTVAEIVTDLQKQGPTLALVGKVNTSIGGWLVSHIKREDAKVAAHIRSGKE